MKAVFLGYQQTQDNKYRLFLAREQEGVTGLKPIVKRAEGIGAYFPKCDKLPNEKVGNMIEYYFDERGNIILP